MRADIHERTRFLIDKSLNAEFLPEEEQSMTVHLRSCSQCQEYKVSTSQVVAALDGFAFEVTPDLNTRVHRSMQQLLRQMEADKLERRAVLLASLSAFLLSFLGSSVVWQLSDFLAAYLHIPAGELQTFLLLVWILPSLLVSFLFPIIPSLLMHHHTQKGWTS